MVGCDPDSEPPALLHHGRDKMYAASRDIWMPMINRKLAATAQLCKHCLKAGKNLQPDITKDKLGETYVPTEPSLANQLDFWGPVNYIKGTKYNFIAVDVFPQWPSAYVCSSNISKNVFKFLKKYIATNGHPRKLHMDQGSGLFSNKI